MPQSPQFYYFCISVIVGFISGILYEPFAFMRLVLKIDNEHKRLLGGVFDFLFSVLFTILCIFSAYTFNFPSFRLYIWIGYALGGIIYLKTLRKLVAFLQELCYNIVRKALKKLITGKKNSLSREEEHI